MKGNTQMNEVYNTVVQMASKLLDIPADRITLSTLIMEELHADSLDIVELLQQIEDRYGIYIPDEEVINMRTVGEVVAYIEENTDH